MPDQLLFLTLVVLSSLATVQAASACSIRASAAASSDIVFNQHQAYKGVDALNLSPRVAFSWSPLASNKTVISGGVGLFYDNPAASLVDNLLGINGGNPPASVALRVRPKTGTLPFDTAHRFCRGIPGGVNAFDITQSFNQIKATLGSRRNSFHRLFVQFHPGHHSFSPGTRVELEGAAASRPEHRSYGELRRQPRNPPPLLQCLAERVRCGWPILRRQRQSAGPGNLGKRAGCAELRNGHCIIVTAAISNCMRHLRANTLRLGSSRIVNYNVFAQLDETSNEALNPQPHYFRY